jgi:hypothetical protein
MTALVFLSIRAFHVLLASTWIGSTIFVSTLLMPAIETSGPSGGQVMMRIDRRGIMAYMAVLGGTTVLTGLYLFWHFTGGFDPSVSTSHAGLAFGTGGVAGILAGIIGGSVVGRGAKTATDLRSQAVSTTDEAARGALMQRAAALGRRVKIGSRVVIALQATALILMAVGHYV